jgi:hypothetical protein
LQFKLTAFGQVSGGTFGYIAFDTSYRAVKLVCVMSRWNQEADIEAGVR